jgi:hypothetical protein
MYINQPFLTEYIILFGLYLGLEHPVVFLTGVMPGYTLGIFKFLYHSAFCQILGSPPPPFPCPDFHYLRIFRCFFTCDGLWRWNLADKMYHFWISPEGVCTDEFLSRKPGFLLSVMHSHAFRRFSVASLVFLFLGLLPLQLNQIWRIFCVMYGEEGGWTLFDCLQKL